MRVCGINGHAISALAARAASAALRRGKRHHFLIMRRWSDGGVTVARTSAVTSGSIKLKMGDFKIQWWCGDMVVSFASHDLRLGECSEVGVSNTGGDGELLVSSKKL